MGNANSSNEKYDNPSFEKNKDPNTINPLSAVDLVIDHSVQVDIYSIVYPFWISIH